VTHCVEKKRTSRRMLGVFYILSTTSRTNGGAKPPLFVVLGVARGSQGGYRGGGSPLAEGLGQCPVNFFWTLY